MPVLDYRTVLAEHNLIRRFCDEVRDLTGDAAEFGVYQGMSARLICEMLPESTVYLFDTFTGMPEDMVSSGIDFHSAGSFRDTSIQAVQKELIAHHNYILVPGEFSETGRLFNLPLKFVHIDCDLYKSTAAALDIAWPLLVPGGVILDDDYRCSSCPGAFKAVNEFVQRNSDARLEVLGTRAVIRRQR